MIYEASEVAEWILGDAPNSRRISELYLALPAAWDTPKRWSIIREYYGIRKDAIMGQSRPSPYELGLERFHTPIEEQLWQDIRYLGLPFFMQYPVGRRFVDFGDPIKRIALEADGAKYHDQTKDEIKTLELEDAGWQVIRITGRDCYGVSGSNRIRQLARESYGKNYPPIDEDFE